MTRVAARSNLLAALVGVLSFVACAPATVPPAASAVLQVREEAAGKIVYVREGNLWIWQSGEVRQLTTGGTWRQPAFSPDGQEIAYVYRDQNFSDIFAMASDGSTSRRLTTGQAASVGQNDWAFRPSWSPDGAQIAYISDAASYFPIVWLMNKDGGTRRQSMLNGVVDAADAISWAPDGKRIAVTAMTREPSQVYVLDVSKGTAERFTNHPQGAFDPAWSTVGETIAYIAREGGRGQLWLRQVEGTQHVKNDKLAYVRSPVWSPDGSGLAVISAQSGAFEIWVAAVRRDGESVELGEFRQLTRDGGVDAASGLSWAK